MVNERPRRWGEIRITRQRTYRLDPDDSPQSPTPRYGGIITEVRGNRVTETTTRQQRLTEAARQVGADTLTAGKVVGRHVGRAGKSAARSAARLSVNQLRQIDRLGLADTDEQAASLLRQGATHARRTSKSTIKGGMHAAKVVVKRFLPGVPPAPKLTKHHPGPLGRLTRKLMRSGTKKFVAAGRTGVRAGFRNASSSLRAGGYLDADRAAFRAAQTAWQKPTRFGLKKAGRPLKWAARHAARAAMRAAVRVTMLGAKALIAVMGAASALLPVLIGIIAVVTALCAILPSFITGAGYYNSTLPKEVGFSGGICGGTTRINPPEEAIAWMAEAEKSSGIPAAWFTAIADRESDFRPGIFADDRNGGTWGLFQLNWEEWNKVYDGEKVSFENWKSSPPPGITDPMIHSRYAGIYFKNRLETVQKLKFNHPDKEFAKLSDLDALVIAHNAGEGTLQAYPNITDKVMDYLHEIQENYQPKPCPTGPAGSSLAGVDEYAPWYDAQPKTTDKKGNKIPTEPYDPLGFAWRNCTSYAAFAVRKYTPHADFRNDWKGSSFGDAKHWHVTAESLSIHVDEVPTVGSVAERTSGDYGHVAFVVAVNSDGSFVINEYNHVKTLGFSSRTARFGEESDQFSKFIHFENPPPS